MATTVEMPQLGETVTEGTILSWAKVVGDTISVDEVLVEISTDKVDTEVPSPVSGTILEILAQEGETVAVGTAICVVGEAGEGGGDAPDAQPEPEPQASPEPEPEPRPEPEPQAPAAEAGGAGVGSRTTVEMPQLGETVTEGTILSWAKVVGDTISVDEVLVEISTDKVDTEVPSPVSGTVLEILAQDGETVVVGSAICVIGSFESASGATSTPPAGDDGSDVSHQPGVVPVPEDLQVLEPVPTPAASINLEIEPAGEVRLVSPVVRRLAREHGIDLAAIAGSGPGGRVTRKDVDAHLAGTPEPAAPAPEPDTPAAEPEPQAPAAEPEPEAPAAEPEPEAPAEPAAMTTPSSRKERQA